MAEENKPIERLEHILKCMETATSLFQLRMYAMAASVYLKEVIRTQEPKIAAEYVNRWTAIQARSPVW